MDFSDFYYDFSANALRCDIPLTQNDSYYRLGESLKESFALTGSGGGDSFLERSNQRSPEIIVFSLRHGYGSSTLELGPGLKAGTALLNMPLPKRFVLPEGVTESLWDGNFYILTTSIFNAFSDITRCMKILHQTNGFVI
jgi:hypothetical protein